MAIAELRCIEPVEIGGMLRFVHTGGRIHALHQFDGFHELVAAIKARNPGIELRGC